MGFDKTRPVRESAHTLASVPSEAKLTTNIQQGATDQAGDSIETKTGSIIAADAPDGTLTALAMPGVRVRPPRGARERQYFQNHIRRLGLQPFIEDNMITPADAQALGITLDVFRSAALAGGDPERIDSYLDVLRVTPPRTLTVLDSDTLLNPAHTGDYVIVAPQRFHAELIPLINHRTLLGHRAVLVDPDLLFSEFEGPGPDAIANYLNWATANDAAISPKYVLLIGHPDGQGTPTFRLSKQDHGHWMMRNETFGSDHPYSDADGDILPDRAVGRLPVDDAGELKGVIRKIISYEALDPPGLWSVSPLLVDGDPHWGSIAGNIVDSFADDRFQKLAPSDLDTHRASLNPHSAIHRTNIPLNEGHSSVFYVGHSSGGGVAGSSLNVESLAFVRPASGHPIAIVTGCLAGSMERHDSLAQELVKSPHLAIGSIGASDVTAHPNAAWAEASAIELLYGGHQTLGDWGMSVKRRFLENDVGAWSSFVHWLGNLLLFTDSESHALLYNYFWDPATRVQAPTRVPIETVSQVNAGEELTLEMDLSGSETGVAFVYLETRLQDFDPTAERIGFIAYNERSKISKIVPVDNGRLQTQIRLPADFEAGTYSLRVAIVDELEVTVASSEVEVTRRSSEFAEKMAAFEALTREPLGIEKLYADTIKELLDTGSSGRGVQISILLREAHRNGIVGDVLKEIWDPTKQDDPTQLGLLFDTVAARDPDIIELIADTYVISSMTPWIAGLIMSSQVNVAAADQVVAKLLSNHSRLEPLLAMMDALDHPYGGNEINPHELLMEKFPVSAALLQEKLVALNDALGIGQSTWRQAITHISQVGFLARHVPEAAIRLSDPNTRRAFARLFGKEDDASWWSITSALNGIEVFQPRAVLSLLSEVPLTRDEQVAILTPILLDYPSVAIPVILNDHPNLGHVLTQAIGELKESEIELAKKSIYGMVLKSEHDALIELLSRTPRSKGAGELLERFTSRFFDGEHPVLNDDVYGRLRYRYSHLTWMKDYERAKKAIASWAGVDEAAAWSHVIEELNRLYPDGDGSPGLLRRFKFSEGISEKLELARLLGISAKDSEYLDHAVGDHSQRSLKEWLGLPLSTSTADLVAHMQQNRRLATKRLDLADDASWRLIVELAQLRIELN